MKQIGNFRFTDVGQGSVLVDITAPRGPVFDTVCGALSTEQLVELRNWIDTLLGEELHTHTDANGQKYRVTANDVCWWDGSGWLYMGHPSDVSIKLTEVQRNG